jgi:hypothetical protein
MKEKALKSCRTASQSRSFMPILAVSAAVLAGLMRPNWCVAGIYSAPNPMSREEGTAVVYRVDSVDPDTGGIPEVASDESAVGVNIRGYFAPTVSSVSFGSGIMVNSFTRNSDTEITATITILSSAQDGYRDVSVTSDGVTYTGANLFLVVSISIVYCETGEANANANVALTKANVRLTAAAVAAVPPACTLGAKEEILFADGQRNTTVSAQVMRNGNPVAGKSVKFSIASGGGSVAPLTGTTGADGKASTTLTAGTATGITMVKAVVAKTGTKKTKVYMYKQETTPGSGVYFDINTIISDDQFTTTPTTFDTQQKIEDWLVVKGSGLAGYRYNGGPLISQVIFDSAQAQGINVELILVTLQKEKGLISDPAPTQAKLNDAMGLPASSNIKSQIEDGAQAFKDNFDNAPTMPYVFSHGRGQGVGYCDGAGAQDYPRVKVTTKATCSLYNYTPWIRYTTTGGGNFLFYTMWTQYGF